MREDVMEGGINGYGVRMNKNLKKAMAIGFDYILTSERLKWHKDFFTTSEKTTAAQMKEEIIKQMSDYSVIIQRPTTNKFAAPTEIYSGKSGYGYDDIMIAVQLCPILRNRFVSCAEKYKAYWN
jgi:hypothetical protein